ncbi:hypothetical protein [Methylobacter sp. sgz302048]|uniref:hypothetical protein n=1 Tax=Methylobacter sp. sgz302048 TaxID=3455945 RepID=UPI003F9EE21E
MTIASFNNIASLGVIKDVQSENLPADNKVGLAWTDAQNMRFKGGSIVKMPGCETLIDTSSTIAPYFYTRIQKDSSSFYVYGGLNKMYCYYSGSHYNITRQSAGVDVNYNCNNDRLWTYTLLNGLPVFNNGVDAPQSWAVNQSTRMANLSGWKTNYTARVIRSFKAYLVAADVTTATPQHLGSRVMWSASALPGALPTSWDETDTTKDAGYQDLSDTEGDIIDMLPLKDVNVIYKSTSTYVMSYVGGTKIFSIVKAFPNIGMLAKNCATHFKGKHFVVTNDDVIIHDGFTYQSIIDNKNKRFLFTSINSSALQRTFVVPNYARSEIWICFATGVSTFPDQALVYNYEENTWTRRVLPSDTPCINESFVDIATVGTIDSYSSTLFADATFPFDYSKYNKTAWSLIVADKNNSKLYLMDQSVTTENGTEMICFVERQNLPIGADQTIKTIKRIYPKTTVAGSSVNKVLNIYVGAQMSLGQSVSWQGPYQFNMETDHKVDLMATGRYVSLKFLTNTDCDWSMENFDVEFIEKGRW